MSTALHEVRTVSNVKGAIRVRDGKILATSDSAACDRALTKHREALIDAAGSDPAKIRQALTASILVTHVETINFEPKVGDVLTPKDAA